MIEIYGKKIHINGIVQGVGFRPFVYSLAQEFNISGWVRNSSAGVDIIANGTESDLEQFLNKLEGHTPPLAKIDTFQVQDIQSDGFKDFKIIHSKPSKGDFVPISPDVSICENCFKELFNPHDRRYRYPFINCTNCGPRFSIIKDIPYDRQYTTMAEFDLCEDCQTEYENPLDRRFHAQPVACPACGPEIWLETLDGKKVFADEGLQIARNLIKEGKIIAVKGLGGFHLACDAFNDEAIRKLRKRKKRSDKAFAVMVSNSSVAKQFCYVNSGELGVLESREKPIVILRTKPNINLPESIAPKKKTIGVMLPYTPLHFLLLEPGIGFPEMLIMTSGNSSDEPIAHKNSGSKVQLRDIADAFLMNNRDIHMRIDDSVVAIFDKDPYFFRRARGYVPKPIRLSAKMDEVLAVGAELKNTICVTKDSYAFVSHHIGDLQNLETYESFEAGISHYQDIFRVKPQRIAHDFHPDYLSTKYAQERCAKEDLEVMPIQHHHAHLASCLADNDWQSDEPVLGVCLDGTGYGSDGKIWGGEFLLGNFKNFERVAHLTYMPLPGGDSATLQPRKIAAAYLWKNEIDLSNDIPSVHAFSDEERDILRIQLEKSLNCPQTSSMGRLFDAVSSLIGIRQRINYEAQAAIELENIADHTVRGKYNFYWKGSQIFFNSLLEDIIEDFINKTPISTISAKFHNAVAHLVVDLSMELKQKYNFNTIALTGGVWQNMFLLRRTIEIAKPTPLKILFHHKMPPNDGGISLGQALIANYSKN